MKKQLSRILPLAMVLATILLLTSCGHKHTNGEWTIDKEATCVENGSKIRSCECGEVETENIPAKGHTSGEWITDVEATCTETGTKYQICSVCSETIKSEIISANGHNGGQWITDVEATCKENGSKHQVCSVCSETIKNESIAANGHKGGNWITDVEATCTEDGSKHQVCSVCSETIKTEIIKSAGKHSYTSKVIKAATCTTKGEQKFTCSVCKYTYTEELSPKGHSWKSATCTSPKTCSVCKSTEGKALGHNKGTDGYCTRCNKKVTIDMNTIIGHPDKCNTTKYFGFCYYKNSADGIKVCWGGENLSKKTINYYTITVYFYNAVGDPAYSEITGKSSKTIKYVGPVSPGKDLVIFGIVDYVPVCSKVVIGEITVRMVHNL